MATHPEETDRAGALAIVDKYAQTGWRAWVAKTVAKALVGTEQGAAIYGHAREQLDLIDARSQMNAQLYGTAMQLVVNDPDMIERARARLVGDAIRKTVNVEETTARAAIHLQAHAEAQSDQGEGPADASDAEAVEPPEQEPSLNPDWAATWAGLAETATTDDLRDRLARVLAGEITRPGSYSRATVRLIAELERADIERLRQALPYVIGDVIFKVKFGDKEVPGFDELNALLEVGLVTDNGATISRIWPAADAQTRAMRLAGKTWGIIVEMHPGHVLSLPIATLTRAGIAVVDLLGRIDEREVFRRLIQRIETSSYSRIYMGKMGEGEAIMPPHEQLAPTPSQIVTPMPSAGLSLSAPVMLGGK